MWINFIDIECIPILSVLCMICTYNHYNISKLYMPILRYSCGLLVVQQKKEALPHSPGMGKSCRQKAFWWHRRGSSPSHDAPRYSTLSHHSTTLFDAYTVVPVIPHTNGSCNIWGIPYANAGFIPHTSGIRMGLPKTELERGFMGTWCLLRNPYTILVYAVFCDGKGSKN